MILKNLSVINYKNIIQADLSFCDKVNCLIGHNGEGKTNLLDAIYFLSFCKSHSSYVDSMCIRHDEDFLVIQGHYEDESGNEDEIYCGLKRGHKKSFKRNKKEYKKLSEHIGLVPLVIVSPMDDALILGGSEERRRFMDMVISQYDHNYLYALNRYQKALLQRNTLLKQEEEPDGELLSLWEEAMAETGEIIYEARQRFVEKFIPFFDEFYQRISADKEKVQLRYVSHGQRGPLLDTIRNGRAKDRIMGYSLHGVHKDDLEMALGGYPLKCEGSQGQSKTFLIALKLSQFCFLRQTGSHTTPILLLDDIFDKLDAIRVEEIIRVVQGPDFGQIFITDTNRSHLDSILEKIGQEHRIFEVESGLITQRK